VNRLALEWVDTALALEVENRELRALVASLLVWIATTRELSALAEAQIEARWPGVREAA
jgi:hypothetical protein